MKIVLKGIIIAALAALALTAPGSAVAGNTQLAGVQTPVDPVAGTYWMSGDLVGWWYTTSVAAVRIHPSGTVQLTGTEQFAGCIDSDRNGSCGAGEPAGTLDFAFNFSGKFDPFTFAEVHGRCHHEITAGTGGFAGASGVLEFKDDPVTGCAYYKGHIKL